MSRMWAAGSLGPDVNSGRCHIASVQAAGEAASSAFSHANCANPGPASISLLSEMICQAPSVVL